MYRTEEALEYHQKASEIHGALNDRIEIATDHYNMNFVYVERSDKPKALKCLSKASEILEELERETNYHHPLIERINKQISSLQ
jgi:tetratricopeptide (TPR) repeat protein